MGIVCDQNLWMSEEIYVGTRSGQRDGITLIHCWEDVVTVTTLSAVVHTGIRG